MPPSVVQSVPAAKTNTFGLATATLTTAAGNALVAVVASHVQSTDWAVSCISDSANNQWLYGGSVSTPSGSPQQVHLSVWYAVNAAAVSSVSATMAGLTTDAAGIAMTVFEASGITNQATLDVVATASSAAGTTIAPSATTTNASDLCIAAAAGSLWTTDITHTADSWTAVAEVATTANAADTTNQVYMRSAYLIASAAGSKSTTWTSGTAQPLAAVIIALKGGTTSTSNPNSTWPQVTTKVAFGTQPNAAGGTGQYTYGSDISPFVRQSSVAYGAPFELGTTEAGTDRMVLFDQDGRFDPTNTASPYWPNVKDFVPYQKLATWNGATYGIFTGYVESFPMEEDDVRTGISSATGVDAYTTLARGKLKSCMQHEVLLDSPWAYWPLGDPSGSALASNSATGGGQSVLLLPQSPRRAGSGAAGFGATTHLAGDPGTGWAQRSDDPGLDQGWALSTGVIAGATFPATGSLGVNVEVWAQLELAPAKSADTSLITLKSSATSWTGHEIATMRVSQRSSTSNFLTVTVWNSSGTPTTYDTGALSSFADGRWHHFALVVYPTSVLAYADGVPLIGASTSISTAQIDVLDIGGQQDSWQSQNIGIGSYAHVAVYPAELPKYRYAAHFQSGHDGFPEPSGARVNRLLTYAGWRGPRALDLGNTVLSGCSTIAGQTVPDALNDVARWEYGLVFVDGLGRFRFRSRTNRFNQTPRGVLGDGTGESHYQAGVVFDYDPTYQYNDIQVTREGPNGTHGTVQYSGDPGGTAAQYFTSTLPEAVHVLSDTQAADRASFLYTLLSVPQVRVKSIVLEPSSDPSLWPVALGAQIGDCYTAKRRPLGAGNTVSINVIISEIRHDVEPDRWRTTFSTLPAQSGAIVSAAGPWVLDDPVNSVLGTTTIPGW